MFARAKYLHDDSVAGHYATAAPALPGHNLPWLAHRREQALARFTKTGYPTRNVEGWQYTDVKPMIALDAAHARANQGDISAASLRLSALPVGPRLVFVNGFFHTALSELPDIAGLTVMPLLAMLEKNPGLLENYLGLLSASDETNAFAQLSLAFAGSGLVVRLEEGVVLDQPLNIAYINTGGMNVGHVTMRNLFLLKAGSRATIMEYTIGGEGVACAMNTTSEIYVEAGARLEHVHVHQHAPTAMKIANRYVHLEAESQYHGVVLTTGARLCRTETQAFLVGEKADANLHTVQLLRGSNHADSTTHFKHDTVAATSNQHCRMILDDHAKGAFQGKTTVARHAQKTDAHQLNKNLLLSRNATVDVKPELEIYADDVKCSHGATTGELDATALFYLQSRGIPEAVAKSLLVEAFADHAIDEAQISDEIKDMLRAHVAEWMKA